MATSRVAKLFIFAATLFLLSNTVAAQHDMAGMSMPGHEHSTKKVISGADRPDLIPDEEAARLVFANVANHPQALLMANLPRKDYDRSVQLIQNYQAAFQKLLDAQPKSGPYDPAAQKRFINQANLLIKITKQHLADNLTADGYEGLIVYIADQKQHMTTTTVVMGGSN